MKLQEFLMTIITGSLISLPVLANSVDMDCKNLQGHLHVELQDITIKTGKEISIPFKFIFTSGTPHSPYGTYTETHNDWCIADDCHYTQWNNWISESTGMNERNTGWLHYKNTVINTPGDYVVTFRMYNWQLQCDAKAVSFIHVI